MSMIKRIFLFLLTNLAVIILIWIVLAILQSVFWINVYGNSYTSLLIYAFIVWFAWSIISLLTSKWVAKKTYNIILMNPEELSWFTLKERIVFETVSRIAWEKWIKMPEVWVYNSNEPNAFATWATKNSSLVAVSSWLLDIMDKDAIEWVIGHEMTHILNWDMVTMVLLQWIINTFVIFISNVLANMLDNSTDWKLWNLGYYFINIFLQLIFWMFASIIVMWFSRIREYKADEGSARLLGKEKMIDWLETLKKFQNYAPSDSSKLATMNISTKPRWWFMQLFASHPSLDDRISRLQNMNF